MRPTVTLSTDDCEASLQILAQLAYPHRADFALEILQQWARHRRNDAGTEKWSRVQPKLLRLDEMVKRRLKGAYWLRWQVNRRALGTGYGRGQREAARLMDNGRPEEKVIREYWEETRSVAHMGLAAGDAVLLASSPAERLGRQWDLVRVAFRPDWLPRALEMAELNAANADRFGVISVDRAILFLRDNLWGQTSSA